jgi:phage terminase small subunit
MLANDPRQPPWVAESVWIAECAAVALHANTNHEVAAAAARLLCQALEEQEIRRTRQAHAETRRAAADVAAEVAAAIPDTIPEGFN